MTDRATGIGQRTRVAWLQAATGVSSFGSRITELALPLVALLVLHASPFDVGLLSSATMLPNLLLGVPAGTWVESMRPRQLMLTCDAVRFLAVGSVPLVYSVGALTYGQLLVVALATGSLTVFADIASASYLPRLVGLDGLVRARSRQMSLMQLADIAGRPVGGVLVAAFGAARAMTADAMSYLASMLMVIHLPELGPTRGTSSESFMARLREGARFAWRNQVNRRIATEAAHYNLFYQAFVVVFLVVASDSLGWTGGRIGLALGAFSLGAAAGSSLAPRLSERWGIGPMILRALVLADLATLALPVTIGRGLGSLAAVCATLFVVGCGSLISGVLAGSLNRAATPERVYSRVVGANRVLTRGGTALGGLLGGVLVANFEPRTALLFCAVGMCSAVAWVATHRITRVRTVADLIIDEPAAAGVVP